MEFLHDIFDLIKKHHPNIYVCLLILVIVVVVVAISAFKVAKYHSRFTKTERDCADMNTGHKQIQDKLDGIGTNLNMLVIFLSGKHKDMNTDLFVTKSPVQLTDFGTEILSAIGGKDYIDANLVALLQLLQNEGLKTALDVENYARVILLREFNTENFTHIKNFMYQNPVYNSGGKTTNLNLDTVIQVMGVYLRNLYLSKHPEIIDI